MSKPGALGPSVWVASDGKAGHKAQALAVARALGEMSRWVQIAHIRGQGHKSEPLELTPRGILPLLPGPLWVSPLSALPAQQKAQLQAPWPTLFIGAGRKVGPYSRYVREQSKGSTLTVHLMTPDLPLSDFDLVVAPEHDGVTGDNVVQTLGAPAYFAPENIEDAELHFADMAEERGFKVAVMLGGDSKSHKMTPNVCADLERKLDQAASKGARLRICCSRRTPTHARVRFRAFADRVGARFWESPADGTNPYLAYLLMSDAVVVTEESTNMASEAAYFGLPVHLARLEGHNEKFSKFHNALIERNVARWFDGSVEQWTYTPLREIDRVADELVKRLTDRTPPPSYERPTEAREGDFDRR